MSPEALVEWFGIPDLWTEHNGNGLFVYFFGYHKARTSRHEWYFYLDNGRVWQSGFNERGINDLTHLKTALEWLERKT